MTNPPGHLWRDKWNALGGPLSPFNLQANGDSREARSDQGKFFSFEHFGSLFVHSKWIRLIKPLPNSIRTETPFTSSFVFKQNTSPDEMGVLQFRRGDSLGCWDARTLGHYEGGTIGRGYAATPGL